VRVRNALNPPRIYTLADLDLDCLALIISMVEDVHQGGHGQFSQAHKKNKVRPWQAGHLQVNEIDEALARAR
jgi:hypothetical protein